MFFEQITASPFRSVAIVGDTLAAAIGKPLGSVAAVTFNVTTQPSGSDVFTGGSNVAYATAIAAAFTAAGWHSFTATGANGEILAFDVVVFPMTTTANVDQIKFTAADKTVTRSTQAARAILRSLAMYSNKAGAQTALEGGAPAAPYYGARPSVLGGAGTDSLVPFGAW